MLFFRCVLTKITTPEDGLPFARNLVFNVLRELSPVALIMVFMHGKGPEAAKIQKDILLVCWYTLLFQFIPKSYIRAIRYLYVWAEIEFKSCLTWMSIGLINKMTNRALGDGDLVTGLVMCFFAMNFR